MKASAASNPPFTAALLQTIERTHNLAHLARQGTTTLGVPHINLFFELSVDVRLLNILMEHFAALFSGYGQHGLSGRCRRAYRGRMVEIYSWDLRETTRNHTGFEINDHTLLIRLESDHPSRRDRLPPLGQLAHFRKRARVTVSDQLFIDGRLPEALVLGLHCLLIRQRHSLYVTGFQPDGRGFT